MARQFQFVSVSKPTEHVSSESRKSNHSHVMRHIHAKKRRLRAQRYEDELSNVGIEPDLPTSETALSNPLTQRFATNSKDPFSSLARPLSSEEYFLLDHYSPVTPNLPNYTTYPFHPNIPDLIVDIQVVVPCTIGHCELFDHDGDHREQMLREWVGLAVTDDTFMSVAILLSTCRYILLDRPGDSLFTQMALRYKQICLRSLRMEIETKPSCVNVISVAKALALAVDEVISGELGNAQKHLQGVLVMVQFGGGPKSLGLTDLLERMYHRFLITLGLTDARHEQLDAGW